MSEPIIESNPNESNGIGLSWVILIAIILLFAIAAVYVAVSIYSGQFTAFFPSEHKDIRGDWGAFGDFFGGVLNPLFSFLALVVLLFTLWQTRLGLELTQKSLVTTQKTLFVAHVFYFRLPMIQLLVE